MLRLPFPFESQTALVPLVGLLVPAAVALSCAQAGNPDDMNQFLPQAGTTGFAGSSGSAGSAGSNQGGFATAGSAGASAGTAGVGGNAGTAGSAGAAGSAGSAGMGGGAGAAGMAGAGGSAGSAGAAGSAGSGGAAGTGGSAGSGGSGGNAGSGGSAGAGGDGGNGGGAGAGNCETQCTALRAAIVHRYSFNGSGTLVEDSIGTADGTVVNTTLGGTGSVALAGGTSDQYVDLPNGIISALGDATFEMWIDLAGVGNYPRVFDFGSSSMGEDVQGSGVTYLFLYPGIEVAANDALNTRVTISTSGSGGETRLYQDLLGGLPFNTTAHVAVVIDDANDLMLLYVDGALKGSVAQTIQLSQLDDVNNWLGRSQFVNDDELQAEFFEFRIYSEALSLSELQFSFGEGPDATFLDP